MAFFDTKLEKGVKYEYSIWPVRKKGGITDKPAATCAPFKKIALTVLDGKTSPAHPGIRISGQFKKEELAPWAISRVKIVRTNLEHPKESHSLGKSLLHPMMPRFAKIDETADPEMPYTYTLIPINAFGDELPTSIVLDYKPEKKK